MESKRLNRKFSSVFWWILYSLPLIALFISLFGTFTIYKETGQDLNFTIEESICDGWQGTNVEKNTYIEKLYFNNNLSIEDVYAFCDTLDFDDSMYAVFVNTDFTMSLQIMDLRNYDGNDFGIIICYMIQSDTPQVELVFSTSPICSSFVGIDFADGWYNTSRDFCIEVNANSYEEDLIEETGFRINPNDTSQLVSTTPFEEINGIVTFVVSIFEKGFYDVVNDFKPFTWEVVIDTLESTFTTIGFNVNSYISSFIILIFAWFVQLTFIHLLIDVILWIPRWLHHYMEGGC